MTLGLCCFVSLSLRVCHYKGVNVHIEATCTCVRTDMYVCFVEDFQTFYDIQVVCRIFNFLSH